MEKRVNGLTGERDVIARSPTGATRQSKSEIASLTMFARNDGEKCGNDRGGSKRSALNAIRYPLLAVLLFCTLHSAPCFLPASFAAGTSEINKQTILTAPLLWRAGGNDTGSFKNTLLSDASIAKDGSVVSGAFEGTCELENPSLTAGKITRLAATWIFTGKVTLETSVTGNPEDYVRVTNGVPLPLAKRAAGSRIKWRATLAPQSSLSQVRIVYSDLSGVAGSFGNELLSGFNARQEIYLQGSKAGDLFQYPVSIKVGESRKSPDACDLKLKGGILSDFRDVRFTLADGETVVPHFLEAVTGKAPDRVAAFWVKLPEIPSEGLFLYMYFGHRAAEDISSGEKVFDLFEDFDIAALDPKKWKLTLGDKTGKAYAAGSLLFLEKAKLTTVHYEFANGILEYQARISGAGAVAGILRETSAGNNDLAAYASTLPGSEHAIAKGGEVKVNQPKPITPGVFYVYRVRCDASGELVFQRYGEEGEGDAQAEVKYAAGTSPASPVGLSSSNQDHSVECAWIRTRPGVDPAPQVDRKKTAAGSLEPVDLPEFYNISTDPDGSLVTRQGATEGYYISRRIDPNFAARILKAAWKTEEPVRSFWGSLDDAGALSVSVSTQEGGDYTPGWENGVTRYVSKKEFILGNQLRWKAELTRPGKSQRALKQFSLEYYPGTIRVVLPNGSETLAPGDSLRIFWEAPGFGSKYPMELSYSTGVREDFKLIASKTDNVGDLTWKVPDEPTDKASVKVADYYDKTIFGVSEAYFSIVAPAPGDTALTASAGELAASSGEVKAPVLEEKASKIQRGKKTPTSEGQYDLLVKNGGSAAEGGYKDGDIVMVQPEGFLWGASERANFTIVRANLTQAEAEEYGKPRETTDRSGKTGRLGKGKVRGGKYRLDLHKKDLLQEETPEAKGVTRAGPLINKSAIVKE